MSDPTRRDVEMALDVVLAWMSDIDYAGDMHSEDAAADAQELAGRFATAIAAAREEGHRAGLGGRRGSAMRLSRAS